MSKFCKNCTFYVVTQYIHTRTLQDLGLVRLCKRIDMASFAPDSVTGKLEPQQVTQTLCINERAPQSWIGRLLGKRCGPDGIFYRERKA